MTSKLRVFVRMNPPVLLGSEVNEDPQKFLDGVYKALSAMRVTSKGKAELDFVPIEGCFSNLVQSMEG